METLFTNLLVRNWLTGLEFTPVIQSKLRFPIDVYTQEDGVGIDIAVSAIRKEDIKVELKANKLHIKYDKPEEVEDSKGDCRQYLHQGITRKSFNFEFALSDTLDPEKLTATSNDGMLNIWIPTKPESKAKTIEIK